MQDVCTTEFRLEYLQLLPTKRQNRYRQVFGRLTRMDRRQYRNRQQWTARDGRDYVRLQEELDAIKAEAVALVRL